MIGGIIVLIVALAAILYRDTHPKGGVNVNPRPKGPKPIAKPKPQNPQR